MGTLPGTHLSTLIVTALMAAAGCTPGPPPTEPVDPRVEAAGCLGNQGLHYATGSFDLVLAPDVGRDPVPPSEDWRLAVRALDIENVHFTTILGCVMEADVERWSVSVEVATVGPVVGDPVALNTVSSQEPPFLLGALSWRDESGAVAGVQYFGGAFAAGGEAETTLHDQAARVLQLAYSGYVELAVDVEWEEDAF